MTTMTATDARQLMTKLTEHLSPMYATVASVMIMQLSDDDAARLGAAVSRYIALAREGDVQAAFAAATADYPEIAPYLAGVDVEAIYATLNAPA